MKDDFLNQFRKPPRREFKEDLYLKISRQDRSTGMFAQRVPIIKRIALGFTMLCLVFTLTLAVSPSARAKFLDVSREVGGLTFIETIDYPGGRGPEKIFPEQKMSMEQARLVFPVWVELPSYAPEDFVLNTEDITVMVSDEYPHSYLHMYLGTGEKFSKRISIWIQYWPDEYKDQGLIIAPESVEEVLVNRQTAALVRGAWNYDTKEWGGSDSLHLRFEKNGLIYDISTHVDTTSVEELVKIAESIP